MFTTDTILTATRLIKNFSSIARQIRRDGRPILVTQKGGKSLVLVEAHHFEELLQFQYEARQAGFTPRMDWGD